MSGEDECNECAAPKRARKQMAIQDKVMIIELYAEDLSFAEIGARIHRDPRTVGRFHARWKTTNTIDRKLGSGRKRKTSERAPHINLCKT